MEVKIIIADDHQVVREGLCSLLLREQDLQVVAEAGNGWDSVRLAEKFSPDLVIMDIAMPELNGIEATRHILVKAPAVKVLVLSMHSDRRFVERTLKAGAAGYLLKDCAFEELVRAIRTVLAGGIYLSAGIANIVVQDYIGLSTAPASPLTPREHEVLQLLTEGKSTKEIASRLYIGIKTVETHRQQIMKKLHLHTVAELTKYAIREGLTSLDI
jgi:DNA-binding NarL/FixJ family response regulator